jgi:hypothetical protein
MRKSCSVLLALLLVAVLQTAFLATRSMQSEIRTDSALPHPPIQSEQKIELPEPLPRATNRAHCFYYAWYGNPEIDGAWLHWDHEILDGSKHRFEPLRKEIGANYWPQLGLYSSMDAMVIAQHMTMMRNAGIGVLVLSWWGNDNADGQMLNFKGAIVCCVRVLTA